MFDVIIDVMFDVIIDVMFDECHLKRKVQCSVYQIWQVGA
jgi:hypothetical protein